MGSIVNKFKNSVKNNVNKFNFNLNSEISYKM